MRSLSIFLSTALLLLAGSAEAAKFKKAPANGVPDEYIVVMADGVARKPRQTQTTLPTAAQVAQLLGGLHGGQVSEVWEHALRGFVVRMPEAKAKKLANDPRVLSVEQNYSYSSPVATCTSAPGWTNTRSLPSATSSPQSLTCTDPDPANDSNGSTPDCIDNWGLDRVDQTSFTRNNSYSFVNNGSDVHVYLLDTGVEWSHNEFRNATNTGSRVSGGADARSHPAVDGTSTNTDDCYGHGTHVAGIIAGRTYGVAKNALLHPVRTRDCDNVNQQFIDRTIRALEWIVGDITAKRDADPNDPEDYPAVVNWSGGNGVDHPTNSGLAAAVGGLVDEEIPLVQSAGNGLGYWSSGAPYLKVTTEACSRTFGGLYPDVIVAGAIDQNDERLASSSSFGSNAGTCIDIWAPGAHVLSADMGGDDDACVLSGTSMAAPHVTGAVAIYLQSNKTATPAQIEQALRSRGTWGSLQDDPSDSQHIGDSDNVVLYADTRSMGSDTAPAASFTLSCPGRQCNVNASASTDDVGLVSYEWQFTDNQSSPGYQITTATGQQAQHTFNSNSTAYVFLKVTDTTGKTDHLLKQMQVNDDAPPVAAFTYSCTDATRVCSFNSTGSSSDTVSRAWTFGDSGSSTATSPNHTYATSNAYTVTLTVTDAAGQTDVETQTIGVDLKTPTNVVATATGANVAISWATTLNASGYTIERKTSSSAWQTAQVVTGGSSTSGGDTPTSSSGVVLYRVLANYGSLASATSNSDVAFVGTFSNDPAVVLDTAIRAEHITELRAAVNGLLSIAGQSAVYSSAQLDPTNLRQQAVDEDHLANLLQNLNTARVAAGLPTISLSPPVFDTPVTAAYLASIRSGLK